MNTKRFTTSNVIDYLELVICEHQIKPNILRFAELIHETFIKDCEIYFEIRSPDDLINVFSCTEKRIDYFKNYMMKLDFRLLSFYSIHRNKDSYLFIHSKDTTNQTAYNDEEFFIGDTFKHESHESKIICDLTKYQTNIKSCFIFKEETLESFKKFVIHFFPHFFSCYGFSQYFPETQKQKRDQIISNKNKNKLRDLNNINNNSNAEFYCFIIATMFFSLTKYQQECLFCRLCTNSKTFHFSFRNISDYCSSLTDENEHVLINDFLQILFKSYHYELFQ